MAVAVLTPIFFQKDRNFFPLLKFIIVLQSANEFIIEVIFLNALLQITVKMIR